MTETDTDEHGEQVGVAKVRAELVRAVPIYEDDRATDVFERGRDTIDVPGASHEVLEEEYFDE